MPNLDDPQILAEGVKPDAAIEYWQDRAKLTWDQAKELADGAKARAFYVTGLYQQDLVNMVRDALKEVLANGETLEDFKARISEVIKSQGWTGHRVENIFRTNMQTAYMAGRYKKMQEVKKILPYWQYVAVMDRKVRPNHAVLHGLVYHADHEFWDGNFPPNGFGCRCSVICLSERQVKKKGLTVQSDMPGPTVWTDPKTGMEYHVNFPGADRGFANNPFKEWGTGKPPKDWQQGLPAGWKSYVKVRSKGIKSVSTNDELADELKKHLSPHTRNGPVRKVIFDNEDYFMATTSCGTYWISQRDFPDCNGFNPARDLKNAWNKIAKGQKLTFNEEYAIETIWHETVHNRQTLTNAGGQASHSRNMMELVTQWVARRTYPRFMQSIGGKAEHQAQVLKDGYGYGSMIKNFDKLLQRFKVADDAAALSYFEGVIRSSDRKKYRQAIADYISANASGGVKRSVINTLLSAVPHSESYFEQVLNAFIP